MCARIVFDLNEVIKRDLIRRLKIETPEQLDMFSRFNVAPGAMLPVIFLNSAIVTVVQKKWGYKPIWATETGKTLVNARIETAPYKSTFRSLYEKQRCIIPVTGYYEWRVEKGKKQPYYIHAKENTVLALAGMYDENTFTILTTQSLLKLKEIHDRMPVILPQALWEEWLAQEPLSPEFDKKLHQSFEETLDSISFYKVSTDVNSVAHDNKDLIKPLT